MKKSLFIIGIVGLPGNYGGFETLVDNLLDQPSIREFEVNVFSERSAASLLGCDYYKGAKILPLPFAANGWQSIIFDSVASMRAAVMGGDLLILGTSGTWMLPLIRILFPRAKIVVNMAGLEWKRSKWGRLARLFLRFNEYCAAKFSHSLIADNEALVEYVWKEYCVPANYIPYGGDHAVEEDPSELELTELGLQDSVFDLAICRAQHDNNMELILEAYEHTGDILVFVSNWQNNAYGKMIYRRFSSIKNLYLIGPIYDLASIRGLRVRARQYIHGHSAGGTNPTLVEAMWSNMAIVAYDVVYNRCTTNGGCKYFKSTEQLVECLRTYDSQWADQCKHEMWEVAQSKYRWHGVASKYASLF